MSFLMFTRALPAFFAGQLANRSGHPQVILAGASIIIFNVGLNLLFDARLFMTWGNETSLIRQRT